MSHKPRAPRASAATDNYSRKAAASVTGNQFDPRNPNTLAPTVGDGDDDEYDAETAAILNLDEIGASSRGVKRNAVNLDGYESDSSNEGFGGGKVDEDVNAFGGDGVAVNKGKKKKEDDSEDDMFGGDSDDDDEDKKKKAGNAGGGKKGVRFLELHEIEGQELSEKPVGGVGVGVGGGKRSGFHDDVGAIEDDYDEEEGDDEEIDEEIGAGGKKRNAPKLDGFHMRAEMEEGRFDSTGNFVRKAADADAVHDTWLQGVTKKDMKKAKESHDKREQEARQRMIEDDALITSDIIATLIRSLERGETTIEALARLGSKRKKTKPKKSWQERRKRRTGGMDTDKTEDADNSKAEAEAVAAADAKMKEQIEEVTAAADRLLSRGFVEIYDEPREALTRMYKRETGEDWADPVEKNEDDEQDLDGATLSSDEWEYRWIDGRDDEEGKVYGPYGSTEMRAWRDAGFFGDGVEFRRKGETAAGWSRIGDF